MTDTDTTTPEVTAPPKPKPTPLELLARRQQPITDVVYGSDHPAKARKGPKAPPQAPSRGGSSGTSLVGDLLDPNTRTKLNALQYRLEKAQSRMNAGKE